MATINRLNESLSVAPQLQPEDMAELAKAGFKTVLNNRLHRPPTQILAHRPCHPKPPGSMMTPHESRFAPHVLSLIHI